MRHKHPTESNYVCATTVIILKKTNSHFHISSWYREAHAISRQCYFEPTNRQAAINCFYFALRWQRRQSTICVWVITLNSHYVKPMVEKLAETFEPGKFISVAEVSDSGGRRIIYKALPTFTQAFFGDVLDPIAKFPWIINNLFWLLLVFFELGVSVIESVKTTPI